MKVRGVRANNRRRAFLVRTSTGNLPFPYAKADPVPGPGAEVVSTSVDAEAGGEAFTYALESGQQGAVHIEQVLEYNRDPGYLRDLLLYKLTIEAQNGLAASPLSKREIIRRLGTSPAQFYRLLDQTNYRKSVDQLLRLLHVLDSEVDLVVRARSDRRANAA